MASDGEISCTNDPNFAVIYSFLKVFGKLYGLEIPSIAKLQQLLENTEEVSDALKELHLRLLRRALKSVQSGRWERCLIKFCHQRGHHQEAWEIERFSYKKASTEVKLKTLKILLEYQFTCHAKFKTAVNALSCKDLRLDPIGRDKNGCVYWLQVDDEANLCLYREDQDEETWQLIARNREELVKVIGQLKSGEEICPSTVSNTNEDSSSTDAAQPTEKPQNTQVEEENEEFLSPESESEHDDEESKVDKKSNSLKSENNKNKDDAEAEKTPVEVAKALDKEIENQDIKIDQKEQDAQEGGSGVKQSEKIEYKTEVEQKDQHVTQRTEDKTSEMIHPEIRKCDEFVTEEVKMANDQKVVAEEKEQKESEVTEKRNEGDNKEKEASPQSEEKPKSPSKLESSETDDGNEVSEAIEEPVMVVTGEGSGADCESSYFIGEEICEPVMYFYGEGCGYDNETGNPELLEEDTNDQHNLDEENNKEECVNGEHSNTVNDIDLDSSKTKMVKNVRLKSGPQSVTKRSLKKQSNDSSEVLKPDTKKHCVRKPSRSDSLKSNSSTNDNDLKREGSANDKTTDSESPNKNNVKKTRGKAKKKLNVSRKLKLNEKKELSPASDADCQDNKTSIIEKRKSSVSSDLDGVDNTETEKEGSPDKEKQAEDDLPPKKLRLEPTTKDVDESHSKEIDTVDNVGKEEAKTENNENNDNLNTEHVEKDSIAMRKKIKANKGKFKRKKILQNKIDNSELDKSNNKIDGKEKSKSKPLKRSLLDATNSDKNKSESQSESEDDMPITSGKRLKIKPKKIITTSRKKVEAKLLEKKSSDDSEEETLYSIAGKKTGKKVLKKKPKGKEKAAKSHSDDSDPTPVRQSRRIAQQKIKEEADRRQLEEVALRELKMIHKKRSKDDEEEWRASGSASSGSAPRNRRAVWRAADSSDPDSDSDDLSDRPVEPDLEFGKSDHEFSPESDLETGEPSEPLKRARTLQEGADDGFCKRCGSGEQPEWILLCDKCDAGYHASCLKPMLFLVPEGDWFCPPCNHDMLISSLESELVKYDELFASVEAERARLRLLEPEAPPAQEKSDDKEDGSDSGSGSGSDCSSGSSSGAVYRLRARRQLPVSYRAQEYDRLISSAIKEEYVEPTTSAGNQGRGKDISTIIEAAEEEKLKAEREEAIAQGKPIEIRKKKKQRRKPRKLNSLEVVSEDDDETDEDFKDTGMESSSEEISSSAERDSADSRSSDSLPIRRPSRIDKKDRPKLRESSPEVKKKKGEFAGSSSESSGAKEWPHKVKSKSKSRSQRDKSHGRKRPHKKRSRGLKQYDAAGNVVRARVLYGGLSDDHDPNDWSPKHRTRQKKINYTEMPNTESEDEMHKGSGKHMPDSSDEFKVDDSDVTSDSDAGRRRSDDTQRALSDLIKTAVVPLEKLPDDVTKAKEEELEAHLNAAAEAGGKPARGRGARGGRGTRGGRGGGRGGRGGASGSAPDDALSKLVGVKIKDLGQEPIKPNQLEKEKKRLEREAKLAEKEAKRIERIQKKEEKEKLKELKAKEREEKKLARLAMQESKRMKKEIKPEYPMSGPVPYAARPGHGPDMRMAMYGSPGMPKHPDYPEQRFPAAPRLQVRAELRGVPVAGPLAADQNMREGTLSVAGSPQPFKPVSEEPSVITRMPHMLNQYRGPMMYGGGGGGSGGGGGGGAPYGMRPQGMMYMQHPGLPARAYPPQYYRPLPPYAPHLQRLPAHGNHHPAGPHGAPPSHGPHAPPTHGPHGPPGASHGPPTSHGPPGTHGPPPSHMPGAMHGGPLHGLLRAGPPVQLHGTRGPPRPRPPPPAPHPLAHAPPDAISPAALSRPNSNPLASTSPAPKDAPIKIKAEVKTEPEYHSPVQSPPRASPEPPRHPKIKVTDNKDRRPRYPLGPYAPQYGPYGPYAPPPPDALGLQRPAAPPPPAPAPAPAPLQRMHQSLHQFLPHVDKPPPAPAPAPAPPPPPARSPQRPDAPPHYLPVQQLRPQYTMPLRPYAPQYASPGPAASPPAPPPLDEKPPPARSPPAPAPPPAPAAVKPEPRAGEDAGSVFGGLVSYFSSQHEDELDA